MDNWNYNGFPSIKTSSQKKKENQNAIVLADIAKIDAISNVSTEQELISLHRELDGKYQSCIANWGHGMYGYYHGGGFFYDHLGIESLRANLFLMRPKLEAFIHGWNTTASPESDRKAADVQVTVNNQVNVNITFEQVRAQIENMTSLTDEQTKEILAKITEIEQAFNEGGSKKTKWEKIKPVLVWLADKSFDVGMAVLPLLLQLKTTA